MSYTLTILGLVNLTARRARMAREDLTSLTQDDRQPDIDLMLQCINEVFGELALYRKDWPRRVVSGSVTTAAGTRDYALPTDFQELLQDPYNAASESEVVYRFKGDYSDFENYVRYAGSTVQSTPIWYHIDPISTAGAQAGGDGNPPRISFYPLPDAVTTYNFMYKGDLTDTVGYYDSSTTATELLPVSDMTAKYLVPAIAELWLWYAKEVFRAPIYSRSLTLARRSMLPHGPIGHY